MIQRKQSIYLLIILFTCLALFAGNPLIYEVSGIDQWTLGTKGTIEVSVLKIDGIVGDQVQFSVWNSYLIYSLAVIGLLAGIALFNFKNRKMQLLMCGFNYLAMLIFAVLVYVYVQDGIQRVYEIHSTSRHYLIGAAAFLPLWNYLAMRGIMRDEKLIRSMDRLR
ncbi:MAG: DUF4293 family protein [Bacteroidetes bacterium]|nr:DUF4293 family protein [Bacteroidota bacterium]